MLENTDRSRSYPSSPQTSNSATIAVSDLTSRISEVLQKEANLVSQTVRLKGDCQDEDTRTALLRSREDNKYKDSLDARNIEDKNVQVKRQAEDNALRVSRRSIEEEKIVSSLSLFVSKTRIDNWIRCL